MSTNFKNNGNRSSQKLFRWIQVVAVLLLIAAFILNHQQEQRLRNAQHLFTAYSQEKEIFRELNFSVRKAESDIRGFALTGRNSFLLSFDSTILDIEKSGAEVRRIQESVEQPSVLSGIHQLDSMIWKRISLFKSFRQKTVADRADAGEKLSTLKGIELTDTISQLNRAVISEYELRIIGAGDQYQKIRNGILFVNYSSLILALLFILISYLLLLREIGKAKRISRELGYQKEYIEITLASITDGLITTDTAGKIIYMNTSAEEMTGLSREQAVGQSVHQVYKVSREEPGIMDEPVINRVLGTGLAVPRENNTMLLSANNEWRVISNSGKPMVDENGKLRGALITFTDESDKKKREVQVKESEERYRTLVEEAAEAIFITDAAGVFLEVNQQAIAMLGYSREEILQLHVNQLVYQRERKRAIPADKNLRPGHRTSYECKMLHKQGQQLIVAFSARLLSDGRYMAIARDITNYRKVQKELSDYKYALDKSTIVTITDATGVITQANENFCKISGYSLDELVGQNNNIVNSGFHPNDFFESFWKTIRSGQVWEGEIRNKARNGNIFWVEATVVPFVDEKGIPYQYAGVRKDITKRKEAEQAIQEILHRYDILMHATNDTIWDWDIQENNIFYNDGIQKIFGYSLQEVVNTNAWWKENIHPDDRLNVYEQLDDVFARGLESLHMEYRYKTADGTYKHIFDRAAVIYNKVGKPIRMIGVMQDISYRKETDRRIDRAILRTQEEERKTIGMELHDNVNQLLSASLLYLSMAETARQGDPDKYATIISRGKEHIQEAIREIRALSHQLAPVCNNHISVQQVYEALVSGIKHTRDIDVELLINGFENVILSGELQINLYRITQEQLHNIVKYAKCKNVKISLHCTESTVQLQVSDDGVGFDPKLIKAGIGLENIRRRVHLFSGNVEINSAPGKGCTVIVNLPLSLSA